ncbi:IucA/IucC family siderophore biosynthesis protein [Providencia rettgeri]|uniref:Aerobactin synthase IucC n=2 Tax=Providencia rettgeri TaxID=587 RepID=A0A9N8D1K7_PRORE|nr:MULTISPECIES: IucA/IucC family protein [Providencia]MBN7843533.1 IucA/IucC family siderophore biosynthesis protein [Providencia rettgeri]MBN7854553.1 IucA/IucC family siderophore biosynthesis protein [Providencia rettgeri]MBN7864718.1 IucA/IucC family siderophore biosynthesis protein [Providencia rettgeri]MBN7899102.1 IucA/IucC family siderophore biosynthesis protein [Providencia rettgeri]MBN7921685.1 IucA/IucC family siderophore biosynthesis protein [Providencia rettgeri]
MISNPIKKVAFNINEKHSNNNALRRLIHCLFAENLIDKKQVYWDIDHCGYIYKFKKTPYKILFKNMEIYPVDTFFNYGGIYLINNNNKKEIIQTIYYLLEKLEEELNITFNNNNINKLKSDIENSINNDINARNYRTEWSVLINTQMAKYNTNYLTDWVTGQYSIRDAALFLDQWGSLEGHPYYPTWKSRPNMSLEDVAALSPEFNATVNLTVMALRQDMAYVESLPHVESIHDWFLQRFPIVGRQWVKWLKQQGKNPYQWLPLPVHDWHLNHWVKQQATSLIDEEILLIDGPQLETKPTMSFRTMLPTDAINTAFIKLPIAVWMTSEMRSLQAKSIHMGPRISQLIDDILNHEHYFNGKMESLREDVGIHYRHAVEQDDSAGRFISVVFRCTNAYEKNDHLLPITVATLFTDLPYQPRPIFTELIEKSGLTPQQWFNQYATVILTPCISMFLLYGVALEAHQQNTQVLFTVQGIPEKFLIRDYGDGRIFLPLLNQRGYQLQAYRWPGILPTIFEEDIEPVRTFLISACLVCHLHELAVHLTRFYRLTDHQLWLELKTVVHDVFKQLQPRVDDNLWRHEYQMFMNEPWQTRSLLSMHIQQYTNYRIQHGLTNPFLLFQK